MNTKTNNKQEAKEKFFSFLSKKDTKILGVSQNKDLKRIKKQIIILVFLFVLFVVVISTGGYLIHEASKSLTPNNFNVFLNINFINN